MIEKPARGAPHIRAGAIWQFARVVDNTRGRDATPMSPHAKPPPAPEREPLSPDEAAVLLQARAALGADFARLPRDVLVQFVRGYRAEPDWPAATVRHLRELVAWRDRERCDEILLPAHAPEQRAEFERMWRTSVIGEDGEGHPVVLEPLGKIPPAEFAALFPEALFLRHCVYTKEALRRLCVHASARRSLRVYKCVVVLDLAGLSLRHTGGRFISMVAAYISAFGNAYPECLQKLYIVNAPLIFAGVWAVVRPLLHPLTAKKVGLFYGRANAAKVRHQAHTQRPHRAARHATPPHRAGRSPPRLCAAPRRWRPTASL